MVRRHRKRVHRRAGRRTYGRSRRRRRRTRRRRRDRHERVTIAAEEHQRSEGAGHGTNYSHARSWRARRQPEASPWPAPSPGSWPDRWRGPPSHARPDSRPAGRTGACGCPRGSGTARSTTPNRPWCSTTAPCCPDATTAWPRSASARGNVVLVRNHEVNSPTPAFGDAADAYDAMAGGGTTTIEVTRFGEVVVPAPASTARR